MNSIELVQVTVGSKRPICFPSFSRSIGYKILLLSCCCGLQRTGYQSGESNIPNTLAIHKIHSTLSSNQSIYMYVCVCFLLLLFNWKQKMSSSSYGWHSVHPAMLRSYTTSPGPSPSKSSDLMVWGSQPGPATMTLSFPAWPFTVSWPRFWWERRRQRKQKVHI